jgi:hypothetical protein
MLSVHQHWDPLKVCLVGKSYPPEFYSFIENPKVRSVMERIAIETEEDYQKLITLLEKFKVKVIRTDVSDDFEIYLDKKTKKYYPPPMCPRDYTGMFGNRFFAPDKKFGQLMKLYEQVLENKEFDSEDFLELLHTFKLQGKIKRFKTKEEIEIFLLDYYSTLKVNSLSHFSANSNFDSFKTAKEYVTSCGNEVISSDGENTAVITRIGKDLIFGSVHSQSNLSIIYNYTIKKHFTDYRCHIIKEISGHTDSSFCPVKPGLIISLNKPYSHNKTFPGWEVVSLPDQSWNRVKPFLDLKEKNKGKWWVPGEEYNDDFTDFVESWLNKWVYYVEETVFDVNILVIDEHNVVCNNYNKDVFDAFERHNITPHIVNFRHRYFWDGGLHCITSDLDREGEQKDFFPDRKNQIYIYEKKTDKPVIK